jgi:hypothetical protein
LGPLESESELGETKVFAFGFQMRLDALAGMVGVRGEVTLWGVGCKDFRAWEINKHWKAEPELEVKCNWKSNKKCGAFCKMGVGVDFTKKGPFHFIYKSFSKTFLNFKYKMRLKKNLKISQKSLP